MSDTDEAMAASKRRWRFSTIHPLAFLAIYLAAVPIFGVIYRLLPDPSFYAPYTRYEAAARGDANHVAADLYAGVKAALAQPPSTAPGADDWRIDPASLNIRDVTVDPDHRLTFTVGFRAAREVPSHAELGWSLHAATPTREWMASFSPSGRVVSRFINLQPQKVAPSVAEGLGLSEEKFATALFRSRDPIVRAQALSWTDAEEQRLEAFDRGRQGDPAGVSQDVWRMVYFSAITITTVGFGDIIPVTWLARTLTGLEAVLGWVLAGLFLNAAAHQLARGGAPSIDDGSAWNGRSQSLAASSTAAPARQRS